MVCLDIHRQISESFGYYATVIMIFIMIILVLVMMLAAKASMYIARCLNYVDHLVSIDATVLLVVIFIMIIMVLIMMQRCCWWWFLCLWQFLRVYLAYMSVFSDLNFPDIDHERGRQNHMDVTILVVLPIISEIKTSNKIMAGVSKFYINPASVLMVW